MAWLSVGRCCCLVKLITAHEIGLHAIPLGTTEAVVACRSSMSARALLPLTLCGCPYQSSVMRIVSLGVV